MTTHDVRIRAMYDPTWAAVGIHIINEPIDHAPREIQVVTDFIVTAIDRGKATPPICYLQDQKAQQLMDDLWAAGFRPQSMRYSDLTFEAQGKHLNDMRAIVATKLNIKLPEEKRNG